MSREIVFDIETYGDIKNQASLKVTVVSIYEYEHDKYTSFRENELSNLWPYLEKAERLIGYNSLYFDLPILNRLYAGDLNNIPHLDMLKVIKEMSGSRYKLDDIAKATLQISKSADGLQAVRWYEEGKIDEIIKYCEQDVKVTKEIYEYGKKNKMLYYTTLTGELTPIAVNFEPAPTTFAEQTTAGMNMTLPL
jgi:DEAD/DEAH box helicase domain-containing protein